MKTAKPTAAAAASRQSTADLAYLAQGRQFLATLKATAKKAGVPLDEFLLRAAFEDERTKKKPEVQHASAPFIRAAVRHGWDARWTSNAIVGHAVCDMMPPREDGAPQRPLPRSFAFAPESVAKDDARWLGYDEFCGDHGLSVHEDHLGLHHANHLHEDEEKPGAFFFRLVGTTDPTRFPAEWVPVSVACWFFGLTPEFLSAQIKAKRLLVTTGDDPLVNLRALSDLLAWLKEGSGGAFAAGAVENSLTRASRHLREVGIAAEAA